MLIRSHTGASASPLEPLAHGGDLAAARQHFPGAPEPFIDLSTGINPHAYTVPPLPPEIFGRLPEPAAIEHICALAARTYGAASSTQVVAAHGVQSLLAHIARV